MANNGILDGFLDFENNDSDVGIVVTRSNSLSDAIFNVLDTETTSAETSDVYNKDGVKIKDKAIVIELAYSRLSPNGKNSHFQDRFYNPGCFIPPSSIAVHNITDKMVEGKPRIEEEIDIIKNDLIGRITLAYNANFDYQMLPFLHDGDFEFMDVYKMATHVWHIGQENEKGHQLTSFKQQEIRFWLGLDDKYEITGEAHRADSDIQVTSLIFQEIRDHYLYKLNMPNTIDAFRDWYKSAPEYKTIPFGPMKARYNENTGRYGVAADELDVGYLGYLLSPRNPMRESYDSFGVTEYLKSAYAPKIAARYRLNYDPQFSSVLNDIDSLEEIEKSMTEDQKISMNKGYAHSVKAEGMTEEQKQELIEGNYSLSEILEKMAKVNENDISVDDPEVVGSSPKGTIKVNVPEYNIEAGVRAVAKKTTARNQSGPSYLDKKRKMKR